MITNLSLIVFLLSPFVLVFFLFKKDLFHKWFRLDFSRKKIAALFTAIFVASFITVGVTAKPVVKAEEKNEPSKVEIVEQKESPDPAALGTPIASASPTLSPTLSPSPSPSSTPSPTPTPTPSPRPKASPTIKPSPVIKPSPKTEAPIAPISKPAGGEYQCSCSKTCTNMASCNEAYFQLNQCGCSARDGDDDGVPCESICPGG